VLEECDRPELAARARQHLAICRTPEGRRRRRRRRPLTRAVFEKNRGDFAAALELAAEGQERRRRALRLPGGLDPRLPTGWTRPSRPSPGDRDDPVKNRVHAFHDPDFAELRKKWRARPSLRES
jgi:hypothetical protein